MARPLQLFNTLTREKEAFQPLAPPKVGMYSCGPTVYHDAHIGNLRSFVFADTLKRVLRRNNYQVTHVMNITDVGHLTSDGDEGEDKMEKGAAREGKSVWDIAAYYTEAFKKDIAALNVLEPDVWCKATDHLKEQIDQIMQLQEAGVTYETADGIYFDTSKLDDYGKLARLNVEQLEAGARVEMGEKRHKTDFALWKFSPKEGPKRAMEWNSPWGVGFPGWHIECSAMSSKYLGEQFDIHTGGQDLTQVHHTNEIAQAETAYKKKPWVKYWLHNEFLVNDKGKMAKTGGDFLTLSALLEKGYPALAYRYFLFTGHYRQQLMFSWEAMDSAKQSLERLKNIVDELRSRPEEGGSDTAEELMDGYEQEFLDALNDDLNMPKALATLWNALRDKELGKVQLIELLITFDQVLGLDLLKEEKVEIPDEITALAEEREKARAAKEWKTSDALRDEIKAKGYEILDGKEGYKLKKAR